MFIEWAAHRERTTVEHVGVDHRCADILVSKQLLYSAYVVTVFEQVCCEGVAEGVASYSFLQPCQMCRHPNGFLQGARVNVMSAE